MSLITRLKTSLLGILAAATLWAAPALGQGTTPLALVPQLDASGNPMSGCLLYFFQAGTVATPQNSYSDYGLTQVQPNPLQCDNSGRVPMHWVANGLIHIRLTDSSGVVVVDTTLQALGPSSGSGGGGGTVDPTTILSTGDEKIKYGTGPLTGFVRENGLTIGNAVSGATERANADTQNLFVYLYNADPNLVVSGGRTNNALNDYNANKTITLPDMRGMANVGLADMGNTATTALTTTYAGCSSVTTLGEGCGSQNQTVAQVNLPAVTYNLAGVPWSLGHSLIEGDGISFVGGIIINNGGSGVGFNGIPNQIDPGFTPAGTIGPLGSGNPLATVQPSRLKTFYIKL